MKRSKSLKLFLIFISLPFLWSQQLYAQCDYTGLILHSTPVPEGEQKGHTLSSCVFPGEIIRITDMKAGVQYQLSTCGDFTFDSRLTLYTAGGTKILAQNDDACGLQSRLLFTPERNGNFDVQIDHSSCISTPGCMRLQLSYHSIPKQKTDCIYTFSTPYAEDFESFEKCQNVCSAPCQIPAGSGWKTDASYTHQWRSFSGPTPSKKTGPHQDSAPGLENGKYLYLESSGCENQTAVIYSPCISISKACSFFNFDYHMYGKSQGEMKVHIRSAKENKWKTIFYKNGNQGKNWHSFGYDLNEYEGQLIQLKITGTSGDQFESDIAFDNVNIIAIQGANASFADIPEYISTDLQTINIEPVQPGGSFTVTPANIDIQNGSLMLSTGKIGTQYTLSYSVGSGDCKQQSSQQFWLSGSACDSKVLPLPFKETFENFDLNSTSELLPLNPNAWQEKTNSDLHWACIQGKTPTPNTGPKKDQTSGSMSGKYLYLEASGNSNKSIEFISSCIDFTNVDCPGLLFWYHMKGKDQGKLIVESSTDQGNTWKQVYEVSGNQGDFWKPALIYLDLFNAIGRFRWTVIMGDGALGDLALDDIQLLDFARIDPTFRGFPSRTICIDEPLIQLFPALPGGSFTGPGISGYHFNPSQAGAGLHTITYEVGPTEANCELSYTQQVVVKNKVTPCQ